jgi:two-component system, OmpR family, phosphate regulon sensor histidine kinase PhoR
MKRRQQHSPPPPWRQRLGGALGVVVVGMVIFGAGVLARIILSWFYVLAGFHPAALVDQGIGAVLTILIVGAVVGSAGFILSRGREQDFMTPLIDAMRRISRGDFSVSLPVKDLRHGPLGPVASGLNEMTEALRTMEEMRREFVANVSHEIQSPLTSISGFAQALSDTEMTGAERAHYLSIIESESKRLSRLSDDLLELTTLDSRELVVARTRYSLARQLREVVLAYEPQWRAKSILLDLALAELEIEADRDMLRRVWNNLFHNAIKFTPQGGSIGITLCREAAELRILFRDSGIGLSSEALPHLFERFYMADRSRTHRDGGGGSGLGLAIVRRIVELHGGTVTAGSEGSGQGSCFSVRLPAAGR